MIQRAKHALGRVAAPVVGKWQRSLAFRVVLGTLVGAMVLAGASEALLVVRVSNGLVQDKTQQSIAEADVGFAAGQRAVATLSELSPQPAAEAAADAIMTALAFRSDAPGSYEVLLLDGTGASMPERGTNLVEPSSVPEQMRVAVRSSNEQLWTYTTVRYAGGASEPGVLVGSLLTAPNGAQYEVYYLFPFTQVQNTIDLVRSTAFITGLLLVGLLGLLVLLVARHVVAPVQETARTAEMFRAGHLDQRVPVRGHDDLAVLAKSFNSMAQAIQVQIRQLEDLSALQQRFVSDVSHELRTPLTTIRMASDVLYDAREDMEPAVRRANELLHGQLGRFEMLLTELLEISRFDAGAAQLDSESTDLAEIVGRVLEWAEPLATDRGSVIRLHAPGPVLVECDPRRVERIVRNLVSNAIEHGEGQPIDVSVAVGDRQAAVSVRDHGRGLSDADLQHVFDRFWRADPSRVRTLGGTGLGLSIALEDAHLHGGTLEAWGAPGQGALFRLVLPTVVRRHLQGPAPLPLVPEEGS